MTDDADQIIDDACAFLRTYTTGDLRFDEHFRPIKFVRTPEGRLVTNVMEAMLQTVDTTLYVPACNEEALELDVSIERFDEDGEHGAHVDRWQIYHGEPPDVRWAFVDIDAGRYHESVIDGAALMTANPLAADEPSLCRWINTEYGDQLAALCEHVLGAEIESPLVVGIDPGGMDVRRRFEVVRIPAAKPFDDADAARHVLTAMFAEARGESA